MSRRDARSDRAARRAPAPPRRGTPAGPAKPRRPVGPAPWVLAALLLAAVIVLALHPWKPRPAPDPIAALGMDRAADVADSLDKRREYVLALPYVDYLESVGEITGAFESRAATAANNASIQVHEKDGIVIPATRSSVERVALVRRSMSRAGHAEALATTNALRAAIAAAHAGQLATWGFVRESYAEYRRAAQYAPLAPKPFAEARWVERMLADPTTVVPQPAPPDSTAAATVPAK